MFYASVADLEACEDADLVAEAMSIRESAEAVYEVRLLAPCSAEPASHTVTLDSSFGIASVQRSGRRTYCSLDQ